ncbi:hypothetical protein KY290_037539 [Solanum tuberosum]|uniref:Uncharacterized protein n=1 Tax=Solanum tuberosum TaxID=4113 RepID=A0ABQ7TVT8_SOLTU|nr:hypothetical protein KY284_036890 [Solanum tuberosum]KAH0738834.1 hypothetical protein KY290_037539 [Solanum tuberosum]
MRGGYYKGGSITFFGAASGTTSLIKKNFHHIEPISVASSTLVQISNGLIRRNVDFEQGRATRQDCSTWMMKDDFLKRSSYGDGHVEKRGRAGLYFGLLAFVLDWVAAFLDFSRGRREMQVAGRFLGVCIVCCC